jgi:hypothetical protein
MPQGAPTPTTTRETPSGERGNYGREISGEFYRQIASSTLFEWIFYVPQICDMGPTALLPLRRKAGRILSPWKIRRSQPGSNPLAYVPEASMLTPRQPKPLWGLRVRTPWRTDDAVFPVKNETVIFLLLRLITKLPTLSRLRPLTLYGPNYSCEFQLSGSN